MSQYNTGTNLRQKDTDRLIDWLIDSSIHPFSCSFIGGSEWLTGRLID